VVACSDDVDDPENNEQEESQESTLGYSEMSDSELAEQFPVTEVFSTKVPSGYLISSDIEIFEIEQEMLDTLFEFEAVKDDAYDEIQKLAQVIDSTEGDILIVVHTDNKDEPDYNQTLSESRAELRNNKFDTKRKTVGKFDDFC